MAFRVLIITMSTNLLRKVRTSDLHFQSNFLLPVTSYVITTTTNHLRTSPQPSPKTFYFTLRNSVNAECHNVTVPLNCHRPTENKTKNRIKSKSAQTQLNSIYCTELHVSSYFISSSVSQFVFKTYLGRNMTCKTYFFLNVFEAQIVSPRMN
jgi:hypothetical protein